MVLISSLYPVRDARSWPDKVHDAWLALGLALAGLAGGASGLALGLALAGPWLALGWPWLALGLALAGPWLALGWPGPWLALGLALGWPLAWPLAGPWPGPWLALGLALGWPLAWPLAGPWPGPWLALGLALGWPGSNREIKLTGSPGKITGSGLLSIAQASQTSRRNSQPLLASVSCTDCLSFYSQAALSAQVESENHLCADTSTK